MFTHPAVQVVREFNREADDVDARCADLARKLTRGYIDEEEFDRQAAEILGGDYR